MDTHEILNRQIADQIEGRTAFEIVFTDCNSEPLSLYKQGKDFFIKPIFLQSKKIEESIYNEIVNIERIPGNIDKLITNMTYDEFYNKYYNFNSFAKKAPSKSFIL